MIDLALSLPLFLSPAPLPSAPAQDGLAPAERVDALAVYGQYRLLAGEPLWPEFDPLTVPLAIFDGERTVLFAHPNPPEGFDPVDAFPGVHWMVGAHEAVRANSSVDLNGARTATLLLPADAPSAVEPAAVLLHEAFHVFNDLARPGWQANEAELFQYPVENSQVLELRRFEVEALRRAETALVPEEARGWAQRALRYREERQRLLTPASQEYERATERYEGLAHYLQGRCLQGTPDGLPEGGYPAARIRERCYGTGAALARLLDRFGRGWRDAFAAEEAPYLDVALRDALGPAPPGMPPPDLSEEERAAISDAAVLEAARYRLDQKQARKEFRERAGWSVEVQAPDSAPLFPQGFDPMNVRRLNELELLHERWLKLGNLGASIEVQGLGATTYGAGDHPLFQGVSHMLVAGIPEEPLIESSEDGVRVEAVGLLANFENARARLEGKRWVIELTGR